MPTISGVTFAPVEGAAELFSAEFCVYFAHMHRTFGPRVAAFREARSQTQQRAIRERQLPESPPAGDAAQPWRVPTVPAELRKPGIEITGPASITPMFINALNPGVDGVRAEGDLDDDEDSAGHRLVDTVRAAHNRMQAVGGGPDVPRRGPRPRLRRAGGAGALLHAPRARPAS